MAPPFTSRFWMDFSRNAVMINGLLNFPQHSLMGLCVVSHPPLVGGDSQIACDASLLVPHTCLRV